MRLCATAETASFPVTPLPSSLVVGHGAMMLKTIFLNFSVVR